MNEQEKYLYLPVAYEGDTADIDEEEPDFDPLTGFPLTPCAVCGALTIPEGSIAYGCPVCGWETDAFIEDEWQPSDLNHGLSLAQAQMNFRTFGVIDPEEWIEGEKENDAEF
mgnify:FL=1